MIYLRTPFIEGFEAAVIETLIRYRGDFGKNLVKQFCERVDAIVSLYAAKDITEAEHARIHMLADAVKARATADGRVTAPDFARWLGV
jgi:hypothetical protein